MPRVSEEGADVFAFREVAAVDLWSDLTVSQFLNIVFSKIEVGGAL